LSEVLRSEFRFCFQKMLRQARVAREMAIDFPCFQKNKKYKNTEIKFINKIHFIKLLFIF